MKNSPLVNAKNKFLHLCTRMWVGILKDGALINGGGMSEIAVEM